MSGIGCWMIAVSSQPDGLVQAPAPSFGCREVAHQHTHACNSAAIHMVALIPRLLRAPECREGDNVAAPTPLVPVRVTDRRGLDLGREQLVG